MPTSKAPAKIAKKQSLAEKTRDAIQKVCDEFEYNPFREMVQLATQKHEVEIGGKQIEVHVLDAGERIAIAKEIGAYMAPKLKSIEVQQEVDGKLEISVTTFAAQGTQAAIEEASSSED